MYLIQAGKIRQTCLLGSTSSFFYHLRMLKTKNKNHYVNCKVVLVIHVLLVSVIMVILRLFILVILIVVVLLVPI